MKKKDVNISQISTSTGLVRFSFSPSANLTTDAKRKTAQNFIIRLFTVPGSNIFDDTAGTLLADRIFNQGYDYVSSQEFEHDVSFSVSQVIGNQDRSENASENVASANITQFTRQKDTIYFTLQLTTEDGAEITVSTTSGT